MNNISDTLEERGNNYGDFKEHARLTMSMKDIVRTAPSFNRMEPYQVEAIDMILHKLGRIINGDPDYIDSWVDIAGYATLVERELTSCPVSSSEKYTVVREVYC